MEEDLNYDEDGDELLQPSEESFGPKPKEILELEKKIGTTISEETFESLDNDNPWVEICSFSRNEEGQVISLKFCYLTGVDWRLLHEFKHLLQLCIEKSEIESLKWIAQMHSLIELDMLDVQLTSLADLRSLSALKYLYIGNQEIASLAFFANMSCLETLFLGACKTGDFSPIRNLRQLIRLTIWDSGVNDLQFLQGLESLRTVKLSGNLITNISPFVSLPHIETIDVSNNFITEIPSDLLREGRGIDIMFEDNPLTSPPWSVIELGMPAVRAYFDNKEKHGAQPLNEGRIIFVGDGSAGKTSLMNRIIYNRFVKGEKQTNGIKIEQWHLQKHERDLRFNMWDFGGQEVQHAVHKFFFTSGCLYILVLDNRKEEEPEYWLQQIETLGGKAPVLVVFNKSDENPTENVDRKFLKEKYPNIVGFYNLSCLTGAGLPEFQKELEEQAPQLSTVNDQFPGNWFEIKKELEASTGDEHHYLVYDAYIEICKKHGVTDEATQRLLLQYFSYIGTVTWFGDNNTYLEHMHVLNPAWITQGVYRIVTGNKTEVLKGQINISDFKELLQPILKGDYVYNESHHGYILALMKKFELCYTRDEKEILIPSRFSKEPKIEYKDFIGEGVRTYLFQFADYLPVAVIHQFIVRNIERAFDRNYWYQGIVIQNKDKDTLAMVQLDKEAKRIYVRIKGTHVIGLWEYIREDIYSICNRYANLPYSEQVQLHEREKEGLVQYEDLLGHIKANEPVYFHPKLQRRFNVGYLMGLFETKESTLEKVRERKILADSRDLVRDGALPPTFVVNILNNNSPNVNAHVNTQVNVEVNIQIVHQLATGIKDDANYLLEEIKESNKALSDALQLALRFADEMGKVKNKEEAQGKGWGRRIKQVIEPIKFGLEFLKTIPEGYEAGHKIIQSIAELAHQLAISMPGL